MTCTMVRERQKLSERMENKIKNKKTEKQTLTSRQSKTAPRVWVPALGYSQSNGPVINTDKVYTQTVNVDLKTL